MTSERVGRKQQQLKRTRLERGTKQLKRTRLNPVGRKGRAHQDRMNELRPAVFARASWHCQAGISPDCTGSADHAHHVLPRSAGGTDTLGNLLGVCWKCHDRLHAHPEESRRRGLLRSRYREIA